MGKSQPAVQKSLSLIWNGRGQMETLNRKFLFTYLELPTPIDTLFALKIFVSLTYLPHGFDEKTNRLFTKNKKLPKKFLGSLKKIAAVFS